MIDICYLLFTAVIQGMRVGKEVLVVSVWFNLVLSRGEWRGRSRDRGKTRLRVFFQNYVNDFKGQGDSSISSQDIRSWGIRSR